MTTDAPAAAGSRRRRRAGGTRIVRGTLAVPPRPRCGSSAGHPRRRRRAREGGSIPRPRVHRWAASRGQHLGSGDVSNRRRRHDTLALTTSAARGVRECSIAGRSFAQRPAQQAPLHFAPAPRPRSTRARRRESIAKKPSEALQKSRARVRERRSARVDVVAATDIIEAPASTSSPRPIYSSHGSRDPRRDRSRARQGRAQGAPQGRQGGAPGRAGPVRAVRPPRRAQREPLASARPLSRPRRRRDRAAAQAPPCS